MGLRNLPGRCAAVLFPGRCAAVLFLVCVGFQPSARAQTAAAAGNIASASLEELMDIEVTSVSKKEQTLSRTGAAVFVISQEDVRRSGASNIPDLLRMAPGVQVAQIDSNQWAITIRGFNNLYSNKVLVLIDGRSVYANSYSGVFWDQLDIAPENIERIEVIRGPGGTVWGANAVNGVINIITKSAADTKGRLATFSSGTRETDAAFLQYGADTGARGAYRVFGKYFNSNKSTFAGGSPAADGWRGGTGGFRADLGLSSRDTLSLQGEFRDTTGGGTTRAIVSGPPVAALSANVPVDNQSGDFLARWEHTLKGGSSTSLQIYDTALSRHQSGVLMAENSTDFEFEHHFASGARQDIVWGLDYRVSRESEHPRTDYAFAVAPAVRVDNLAAVFAQDEISLSKSVFLTLGSKFEHNSYTGFEYEPSAQLVWQKSDRTTFWASGARAIRQPDGFDFGVNFRYGVVPVPGVGPALVTISGSKAVVAEELRDFEIGYRSQVSKRISLDMTAFLAIYNHLQTSEPGTPYVGVIGGVPQLVVPETFGSNAHARNLGGELSATWKVASPWKLTGAYSLLSMSEHQNPGSRDTVATAIPGDAPRHQAQVRSQLNLGKRFDWDGSLKYVSQLRGQAIPGYFRLDTRFAWRLNNAWELSVTGQNLSSGRHFEFIDISGLFLSTAATRQAFAKLTWRF